MNAVIVSFLDELEKIAASPEALKRLAARFAKEHKMAEGARNFYRVIKHNKESKKFRNVARAAKKAKDVPFVEGIKRNIKATGRRMVNPKAAYRAAKYSVTNPAASKLQKGLAGAGVAYTGYDTAKSSIPKNDASGDGRSRLDRAATSLGGAYGGFAGKGISGGIAGAAIGAGAGHVAGKVIDKIRGYKPPQ